MSIATKIPVSETRIGFTGVGFDVYERLIRATPARTAIRMAYDGKDLEIMVKGPVHDHYGRLLDRLITAVTDVLGIRSQPMGETTWIRPDIERGLEADQCYVFDPAKLATVEELLARRENDVAGYPNPDLAVEVDISRPQTDRPAIYAALEVPELWTFDSERVTIASFRAASTSTPVGAAGFRSRHPTPHNGWSRKTPVTCTPGKSGFGRGQSCSRDCKEVRRDRRSSPAPGRSPDPAAAAGAHLRRGGPGVSPPSESREETARV